VFLRLLLLVWGVFACSTAVIMIKSTTVDPVPLAAYRLLLAAAVLLPLFLRDRRRHAHAYTGAHLRASVLPGLLLAGHFVSWIIGARQTVAANASLIVNLVPIVMPFYLAVLAREHVTRREIVGTAVALVGLALLAGSDYTLSRDHFRGDVICFISMLLFASYLALARRNRHVPSVWLYLVPLYAIAGLACAVASLVLRRPLAIGTSRNAAFVVGLALVPTILGHSTLNYAMKHLRGQVVGIVNLGQFVFAGTMGYLLLQEIPTPFFYPASALLVAGAWVVVTDPHAPAP
jgi:drug/metabolite transporter (DMT)-like permease